MDIVNRVPVWAQSSMKAFLKEKALEQKPEGSRTISSRLGQHTVARFHDSFEQAAQLDQERGLDFNGKPGETLTIVQDSGVIQQDEVFFQENNEARQLLKVRSEHEIESGHDLQSVTFTQDNEGQFERIRLTREESNVQATLWNINNSNHLGSSQFYSWNIND